MCFLFKDNGNSVRVVVGFEFVVVFLKDVKFWYCIWYLVKLNLVLLVFLFFVGLVGYDGLYLEIV